jgi:hypothetical protein
LYRPNHAHGLGSAYRPPGHWVGEEAETWPDPSFQEAVVLLDDTVYLRTILLYLLAGLAEIGGGWLEWQGSVAKNSGVG